MVGSYQFSNDGTNCVAILGRHLDASDTAELDGNHLVGSNDGYRPKGRGLR
jgi:hypothetical protein